MCNILLIILLFLLIIISTFSVKNKCNNFAENFIENISYSEKQTVFSDNESIEITTLPSCIKNINVDYGLNINTINSDGVSINQDINDPLIHTIEVDNKNYNLVKVEWRKTNFTINNKPIGLSLHLIHSDYQSINNFIIIIPLDLNNLDTNLNNSQNNTNINNTILDETNDETNDTTNDITNDTTNDTSQDIIQTESFKNIFYKKMDKFFKKYNPVIDNITKNISLKDIKNINKDIKKLKNKFNLSINYFKRKYDIKNININSLIKKDDIPIYECCKKTIGNVINMNLCQLKIIIENNDKYYIIKDANGNTNLITEPNVFDEDTGLLVRNYIEPDKNLVYIKP
jgi:hypothetical protein